MINQRHPVSHEIRPARIRFSSFPLPVVYEILHLYAGSSSSVVTMTCSPMTTPSSRDRCRISAAFAANSFGRKHSGSTPPASFVHPQRRSTTRSANPRLNEGQNRPVRLICIEMKGGIISSGLRSNAFLRYEFARSCTSCRQCRCVPILVHVFDGSSSRSSHCCP